MRNNIIIDFTIITIIITLIDFTIINIITIKVENTNI